MSVKLTLDNGTEILLDRLDSVNRIQEEEEKEKYRIEGIGSLGEYDTIHEQFSSSAIRTIEFLP